MREACWEGGEVPANKHAVLMTSVGVLPHPCCWSSLWSYKIHPEMSSGHLKSLCALLAGNKESCCAALTEALPSLPGYKTITVRKFMQVRELKPWE